ncbi:ATP-binding protein [Stella sp.]|uniref:ATP-binding protein n=1 Tax=Stella sp. TaxID=2912054 RepID=UPI0035ADF6FE
MPAAAGGIGRVAAAEPPWRDLLLGAVVGIGGFAINRVPLSVGWGVEFHLGALLPFLLLPRSLPGAALAGALAPAHLLLVWNHPVAWAVTACEIPLVALVRRWTRADLISADAVYWAVLGLPAAFLAYHFLSEFDAVPAMLAALQQGLGSFFSVSLASVAAMLLQLGRSRPGRLPPIPLRTAIAGIVSVVTIATGIVILAVDARLYWRTLVDERVSGIVRVRERADAMLERLHREAQATVQALVAASRDGGPSPKLAADAGQVLRTVEVQDHAGRPVWTWAADGAAPGAGIATVTVPLEGNQRRDTAVATIGLQAMASRLAGPGTRGAAVVVRDAGGTVRVDPAGITERIDDLDGHCLEVGQDGQPAAELPDLRPMVASILSWTSPLFCSSAPVAAFPGLVLTATMGVSEIVERHHRAVLDTMLLVVGICGLGVTAAGFLSTATVRRIEMVREALATGSDFRFEPRTESGIAEIRLLESDIGRLSRTLAREAAEAALMRRRMETIAAHTPIVVYILDLSKDDAAPPFVTRSIEPVLGHPPAGALTPAWWTANLHPEDAPRVMAELGRLTETGGFAAEFRLRGPDGAYRWVYHDLRLIEGAPGHPREAVGIMIDVTQRKHSETRLIETANLVALGEMSAAVAHELTQPLHVIGLAAENLLDQVATTAVVSERAVIKLRDMVEQAHRAAGIVHRMRQLGRKEAGAPTPIRVGDALEAALRPLHVELKALGITLVLEGDGLDSRILGQPGLLEQVAINLVLNARDAIYQRHADSDAMAEVEDRIAVLVTRRAVERRVSIRVRDTGTGLDPAVLRRAFEPFFTTKEVGKGLGLGLAICHGTVRDLGGHIEARNWQHGAEFEVLLPVLDDAPAKSK